MHKIVLLALLFFHASCQLICSTYCIRGWNGMNNTDQCGSPFNNSCTACDPRFFTLNNNQCQVNTNLYNLESTLLTPGYMSNGNWLTSTGIVDITQVVAGLNYLVTALNGTSRMAINLTLNNNHSSVRMRATFIILDSVPLNITFIVDQVNNSHLVDQSLFKYTSGAPDYVIYSTPNMPHNGTTLTLSLLFNGNKSPTNYNLAVKEIIVFSTPCPSNCGDCYTDLNTKKVLCTSCIITYFLSLSDYQCYSTCPNGTYPSGLVCLLCAPACAMCRFGNSNCVSCSQIYNSPRYLFNGTCLTSCPAKTYLAQNIRICLNCPLECSNCTGPDLLNECYECTNTSTATYYLLAQGKGCSLSCPSGQVINPLIPNVCSNCINNCLTCQYNQTTCTSCFSNSTLVTYFLPSNNSCLLACPTNFVIANKICVCPAGYLLGSGNCVKCIFPCDTCFALSNSSCTKCLLGFFMPVGTNQCVTSCPSEQFSIPNSFECYNCSKGCATCIASAFTCTSCKQGLYLFESTCVKMCPNGYGGSTNGYGGASSPNICVLCINGTLSFNNSCIFECPALFKEDPQFNMCVPDYKKDLSMLDFSIIPTFINKGAQLCINLVFRTRITVPANILSEVEVFVSTYAHNGTSRLLIEEISEALHVSSVDVAESLQVVKVFTNIPATIANPKDYELTVSFNNNSLLTYDGVPLPQHKSILLNGPVFTREAYKGYFTSQLDGIGIAFSVVCLALLPLTFFKKYTYYPVIELVMQVQLLRLLGFATYDIDYHNHAFLRGFDSSQMQWMPNLQQQFAPITYFENTFPNYQFKSVDMNFLNLASSNLLFLLIFQPILGYLYFLNKDYYRRFILWTQKTLIYVCSINLSFAAISSFISLFINSQDSSSLFAASQLLGFAAIVALSVFFFKQSEGLLRYKMFLLTSLAFCVLTPFFSLSFVVCLVLLNFSQGAILFVAYRRRKKSDKRTKPLLLARLMFLVVVDVILLGKHPAVVITCGTLHFGVFLGLIGYIIYRSFSTAAKYKQPQVKETQHTLPNDVKEQELEYKPSEKREYGLNLDDKIPESLIYFEEDQKAGSPNVKKEEVEKSIRKDSHTYYSPRKNWRKANLKSKTIYNEEEQRSEDEGLPVERQNTSEMHLSIHPFNAPNS